MNLKMSLLLHCAEKRGAARIFRASFYNKRIAPVLDEFLLYISSKKRNINYIAVSRNGEIELFHNAHNGYKKQDILTKGFNTKVTLYPPFGYGLFAWHLDQWACCNSPHAIIIAYDGPYLEIVYSETFQHHTEYFIEDIKCIKNIR